MQSNGAYLFCFFSSESNRIKRILRKMRRWRDCIRYLKKKVRVCFWMYKARWHHRWTMRRAFVVSPFPHFIYKYIYIYRAVWTAPVDDDDLASTFPSSRAIGTWANTSRSSFIFPPFLILKTGRHDPFASNFSFVAFFFSSFIYLFIFFRL